MPRRLGRSSGAEVPRPADIFASLALSNGMEVARVSVMLGHSNPATMHRVYTYAIPGSGRTVAAVMDKVLSG